MFMYFLSSYGTAKHKITTNFFIDLQPPIPDVFLSCCVSLGLQNSTIIDYEITVCPTHFLLILMDSMPRANYTRFCHCAPVII